MAQLVVLQDFFERGRTARLRAGDVIDDTEFDIPQLQRSGLSVTPFQAGMEVVLEAYNQVRRNSPFAEGDLVTLFLEAGFLNSGPPTGPAGGDLNGIYPDPGVATVGGTTAAVIGAHPGRTDNPHAVTVGQTGGDAAGTPRPPTAHDIDGAAHTFPGGTTFLRADGVFAVPLPTTHIDGLLVSRPTVSTVSIAVGAARDDTDVENLIVGSPLTADVTASGVDGLDTGSEAADTWYSVWVIGGAGNAEASLLSLSSTSGGLTFPGTYTVARRVGWVRNDASSDFRPFTMRGQGRDRDAMYNQNVRADLLVFANQEPTVFTSADVSEFVPPTSLLAELYLEADTGANDYIELRPTGSGLAINTGRRIESGVSSGIKADTLRYEVDSSQTFDWRKNDLTGTGLDLYVYGYRDEL